MGYGLSEWLILMKLFRMTVKRKPFQDFYNGGKVYAGASFGIIHERLDLGAPWLVPCSSFERSEVRVSIIAPTNESGRK